MFIMKPWTAAEFVVDEALYRLEGGKILCRRPLIFGFTSAKLDVGCGFIFVRNRMNFVLMPARFSASGSGLISV